ncbi:unnamed protein product [Boreogadus saida]
MEAAARQRSCQQPDTQPSISFHRQPVCGKRKSGEKDLEAISFCKLEHLSVIAREHRIAPGLARDHAAISTWIRVVVPVQIRDPDHDQDPDPEPDLDPDLDQDPNREPDRDPYPDQDLVPVRVLIRVLVRVLVPVPVRLVVRVPVLVLVLVPEFLL